MSSQIEVANETALAVIESLSPVKLFEPGVIDPILDRIKAEVRSVPTDISTEGGRKSVASLAFKVARSKTFIDNQRLKLVKDEKERLKAIDREGARIWDELEALQREVRKPLTDWEDAEKQRVAGHELAISEISGAGPYTLQNWQTLPLDAMKDRLSEIKGDARDWQEFTQRAELAKTVAVAAIESAIEKRSAHEVEQAELIRLRKESAERAQKEREEQVAKAAAEKAKQEAEWKSQAEQQRLERESREREEKERKAKEDAIRARLEAEAKALKAERDAKEAVEKERQRVEDQKKTEAEAQAKREANKQHRAKVDKEAIAAITKIGFDEESAKAVISHISKGEVPNVYISY